MAQNIRTAVIDLLKQSGHSPIEAVQQCDEVYSSVIQRAAPGPHTLVIGQFELEFTKPGIPSPIELDRIQHGRR
jgi:hypothetical protein